MSAEKSFSKEISKRQRCLGTDSAVEMEVIIERKAVMNALNINIFSVSSVVIF
jgi:hypothetical protein